MKRNCFRQGVAINRISQKKSITNLLPERHSPDIVLRMIETKSRTSALEGVVTREEFMAMLQAAADSKDRAIMALAFIGLRAGEISHVTREWVDLSACTIKIAPSQAKKRRGRVVAFGQVRLISEIISAFFVLERAVDLDRVSVYRRVRAMASRAKLTHPVTVHSLRATGATMMASAGFTIDGLRAQFGWSELRTAQHYINKSGVSAQADMLRCGGRIL